MHVAVSSPPSSDTHARNLYGHYAGIPTVLNGLIAPGDCQGNRLCQTRSGPQPDSDTSTATTRYNAYVTSPSHPDTSLSASYTVDATGNLLSGMTLSYEADGQVATKKTFATTLAGKTECERITYAYDGSRRLISERRQSCGNAPLPGTGDTRLAYDASGNMTLEQQPNGTQNRTAYGGLDRMRRTCGAQGCRTPHYGPRGGVSDDGEQNFVYNDAARLASRQIGDEHKIYAYLPNGLLWATQATSQAPIYLYRAGNELVSRVRHAGTLSLSKDAGTSTSSVTSHNFWFGGLRAHTVTGSDAGEAKFTYGVSDYMGSVFSETNGAGQTPGLRRYDYAGEPYRRTENGGRQTEDSSAQYDALQAWPLGYAGGYEDPLSDKGQSHPLTFFGVREQENGRFLERDTNLAPINGYLYADDDWPNKVDATGHEAEPVFGPSTRLSAQTDLPTCDELNLDCQMPALPDTSPSNDGSYKWKWQSIATEQGFAAASGAPALLFTNTVYGYRKIRPYIESITMMTYHANEVCVTHSTERSTLYRHEVLPYPKATVLGGVLANFVSWGMLIPQMLPMLKGEELDGDTVATNAVALSAPPVASLLSWFSSVAHTNDHAKLAMGLGLTSFGVAALAMPLTRYFLRLSQEDKWDSWSNLNPDGDNPSPMFELLQMVTIGAISNGLARWVGNKGLGEYLSNPSNPAGLDKDPPNTTNIINTNQAQKGSESTASFNMDDQHPLKNR